MSISYLNLFEKQIFLITRGFSCYSTSYTLSSIQKYKYISLAKYVFKPHFYFPFTYTIVSSARIICRSIMDRMGYSSWSYSLKCVSYLIGKMRLQGIKYNETMISRKIQGGGKCKDEDIF